MEAKLAIEALRAAFGILSAVRNWKATASQEQLAAFIAGLKAQDGSVDDADVEAVLADLDASQDALESKIAAAKV